MDGSNEGVWEPGLASSHGPAKPMPAFLTPLPFPTAPLDGLLPLVLVPVCCGIAFWLRMVKLSGAIAGCLVAVSVAHGMGWAGEGLFRAIVNARDPKREQLKGRCRNDLVVLHR